MLCRVFIVLVLDRLDLRVIAKQVSSHNSPNIGGGIGSHMTYRFPVECPRPITSIASASVFPNEARPSSDT